MSERPFLSSDLRTKLLRFLQDRCKMRTVRLASDIDFKFDAVLVGQDPLNVIVIETTQNANQNTLKQLCRKIQSFAWSLYAQQKHNLVTLILVLPDVRSPERIRRALGDLNGSARVFLLAESADSEQMEIALNSLAAPAFALSKKESVGFAQVEELLEGLDARPILQMSGSSVSDKELKTKLIERLESLASEVENALKKP